jgi:hypothetical protein
MKKLKRVPPLPPLSLAVLDDVEKIEEYTRSSLRRCGDNRYYNAQKAVGIMRTCVIADLQIRLDYYQSLTNYHPGWIREIKETAIQTIVGLVGADGMHNEEYFTWHVREAATQYFADRALQRRKETLKPKTVSRKSLRDSYLAAFPETKILDICWAAEQRYREWKRWIKNAVKDGSKPDRAFRSVLSSDKPTSELRSEARPSGWK